MYVCNIYMYMCIITLQILQHSYTYIYIYNICMYIITI